MGGWCWGANGAASGWRGDSSRCGPAGRRADPTGRRGRAWPPTPGKKRRMVPGRGEWAASNVLRARRGIPTPTHVHQRAAAMAVSNVQCVALADADFPCGGGPPSVARPTCPFSGAPVGSARALIGAWVAGGLPSTVTTPIGLVTLRNEQRKEGLASVTPTPVAPLGWLAPSRTPSAPPAV